MRIHSRLIHRLEKNLQRLTLYVGPTLLICLITVSSHHSNGAEPETSADSASGVEFNCKICSACKPESAPDCAGGWQGFELNTAKRKGHFILYTPKSLRLPPGSPPVSKKAPLVVMMHGCLQNAQSFSQQTKMNFLAEANSFYVLWPEQTSADNPLSCWPWFQSNEHMRTGPVADWIVTAIDKLKANMPIDPEQISIAGLSAGGAFSSLMLSCYPDIFQAAAVHSGLEFASAKNEKEAKQVMKSGPTLSSQDLANLVIACQMGTNRTTSRRLLVVHGSADSTVNIRNATALQDAWLATQDLLDNGKSDQSYTFNKKEQSVAESGSTRAYQRTSFSSQNSAPLEVFEIDGMTHAWSGGDKTLPFSDPRGPSATEITWKFFSQSP